MLLLTHSIVYIYLFLGAMFNFGFKKLDLDKSLTSTTAKYGTELYFCAVIFFF